MTGFPDLETQEGNNCDRTFQLVDNGSSSVRAEMIDMNSMVVVMQDNVPMLTRTIVERFCDWIPPFMAYPELYMSLEENFFI